MATAMDEPPFDEHAGGDGEEDNQDDQEDQEAGEDEDDGHVPAYIPVIQDGRQITFRLGTLNPYITCVLCDGYLVEATTISECMHTFCKSCIFKYLEDSEECPICQTALGANPTEHLKKDTAIQSIIYKLVPGLQKRVEEDRETWEVAHGIKRPTEAGAAESEAKRVATGASTGSSAPAQQSAASSRANDEQISFVLKLDDQWVMSHNDAHMVVPPEKLAKLKELDRPFIKTSSRATVLTLKKFLLSKLKFDSPNDLDICLNGEVLGQELSLEFVQKTRNFDTKEQLVLRYRPNVNLL